ncbi:peptidase [Idiomarina sp. OT37-5b]|jgi:predicted Zn-dependent protease|uniref:Peptidase n=1 Tax=Idiomarina aquatica TaxID=1327752 RepID=A0AA94JDJ0_9GAMM|nr:MULTISPECIES: M48 family metallopeptidase [Idiomarina]AVJ55529.1 peptidase [Idiomarina sp. OT37-5b]RUO44852.1 peptidase [Idiomarina aquatica]
MRLRTVAASLLATLALVSCSKSPTGRSQLTLMPTQQLEQMGDQSYQQMKQELAINTDAATNAYVRCVADALIETLPQPYRNADWEVTVFADDAANAFALPGYNIGVYDGLLKVATNQHQLAAVIGHEIGHVIAEHSNERVSSNMMVGLGLQVGAIIADTQLDSENAALVMAALGIGAQVGILLPYSRTHESESDRLGLDYMAAAGFRLEEAAQLWRNMAAEGGANPPELLSTHPAPSSRIEAINNYIPQLTVANKSPNCRR